MKVNMKPKRYGSVDIQDGQVLLEFSILTPMSVHHTRKLPLNFANLNCVLISFNFHIIMRICF